MSATETFRPFWRQGDIFFVRLDQTPDFAHASTLKNGVIARGEQTGHMHRVSRTSLAEGAALVTMAGSLYLRAAEAGATIVHDEHGAIELPAGIYAIANQREFDGLRWRTVLD